jgi:hypothetical protein
MHVAALLRAEMPNKTGYFSRRVGALVCATDAPLTSRGFRLQQFAGRRPSMSGCGGIGQPWFIATSMLVISLRAFLALGWSHLKQRRNSSISSS